MFWEWHLPNLAFSRQSSMMSNDPRNIETPRKNNFDYGDRIFSPRVMHRKISLYDCHEVLSEKGESSP